jgi:quinol monooxygenase YgiN
VALKVAAVRPNHVAIDRRSNGLHKTNHPRTNKTSPTWTTSKPMPAMTSAPKCRARKMAAHSPAPVGKAVPAVPVVDVVAVVVVAGAAAPGVVPAAIPMAVKAAVAVVLQLVARQQADESSRSPKCTPVLQRALAARFSLRRQHSQRKQPKHRSPQANHAARRKHLRPFPSMSPQATSMPPPGTSSPIHTLANCKRSVYPRCMTRRTLFRAVPVVAAAIGALFLSGCRIGYPFKGPGFDSRRGVIHPEAQDLVFVTVTQGDVASGSRGQFSRELEAVLDSMDTHDGLIGYTVRRELFGRRVWTMSVWIDRASMERFAQSPAHRSAIRQGGVSRESFFSADTYLDRKNVPISWPDAELLLEQQRTPE